MLFVCHPKILHTHCLQFLLGENGPKRNWRQCLCKFWGDKQRALWFDMVFSGVVIFSFLRSALVLARWWARVLADVFEKNENKNKTTSVYWLLRAWSLSSSCPLALELITDKILRIFLSVCNYYKSRKCWHNHKVSLTMPRWLWWKLHHS